MTPDYLLSDAEVYIQTAWAMVKHMSRLNLLNYVEPPSRRVFVELPSWVPDFSVPLVARLIEVSRRDEPGIDASGMPSPISVFSLTKENALVLRGARLAAVMEKGPRLYPKNSPLLETEWFLSVLAKH
ncbi:hypothetical protein B0T16DRAFT_423261 [Cercophora newfieldiana]|uniref:Uncharacterized protein n=1 Tax=Cercophora newfieldiana TaxID=92897 RepID=A0AA40CJ58_9PEZI|nr:hypothetical protein B0T16DRAFT_423261 [Cercophora newfieldiana]